MEGYTDDAISSFADIAQCLAPSGIYLEHVAYIFITFMLIERFTCFVRVVHRGYAYVGAGGHGLPTGLSLCLQDRYCCVICVT